jgi:PAS domain-containing protein
MIMAIEHLPVPAYALDRDGTIVAWNPLMVRLTGVLSDVIGRADGIQAIPFTGKCGSMLANFVLAPDLLPAEHLSGVTRDGDWWSAEMRSDIQGKGPVMRLRSGPLVVDGQLVGAVELFFPPHSEDPRRSIALDTVSRLMRAVRHDIMNELTIVLGYISLVRDTIDDPSANADLERAAEAAGEIRRQIEYTREYQGVGLRPPTTLQLETMIRESAESVGLSEIRLIVSVPQVGIRCDPLMPRLFEQLFRYSVASPVRPNTIRITVDGEGPVDLQYEDDAPSTDRTLPDDGKYSRGLGYGLFLMKEILALDGMTFRVLQGPTFRANLRIPGHLLVPIEKEG